MSTENAAPEETPLLERMQRILARSEEVLKRPDIPTGLAMMTINQFRVQLSKIYGKDAPELQHFPLMTKDIPPRDVRPELVRRVENGRRIVDVLSGLPQKATSPLLGSRVFIGHGRSPLWRELKDFIADRMKLPWDEFNREPVAGLATSERLQNMLSQAGFAFLVMTAEEEHADRTLHARANVVHEVGLFQGRLGLRRAIVLLEEGCAEFSNIIGLSQIRFPRGDIAARFEEIRRVLEREGLHGP